jgi:hypothetical protein
MKISINKYSLILLTILFCSNRCAREGTSFHIFNGTERDLILLSKSELIDYKNNFLSRDFINSRNINRNDDRYLGFEDSALDKFKNDKGDFLFYFISREALSANKLIKVTDSIIIMSNKISFFKSENRIIYNKNEFYFINMN